MKPILPARRDRVPYRGFSLTEMLVVVAIVGVITAIALPYYGNIRDSALRTQATDRMEQLNRAVKLYNQSNWELVTAADPNAVTDELKVLRSLQYNWQGRTRPMNATTPYYPAKWNPVESSDASQLRFRWNGRSFELLGNGVAGKGLLMNFQGTDVTTDYAFPPGYKPEGMP